MSQLFASGDPIIGASTSAFNPNEYSGLISFGIDWFDLLAVQGILECLLQHFIHILSKIYLFGTWFLISFYYSFYFLYVRYII